MDDFECPACFANIDSDPICIFVTLPCKHNICIGCLCKLIVKSCPMCRYDFESSLPESLKSKKKNAGRLIPILVDESYYSDEEYYPLSPNILQ